MRTSFFRSSLRKAYVLHDGDWLEKDYSRLAQCSQCCRRRRGCRSRGAGGKVAGNAGGNGTGTDAATAAGVRPAIMQALAERTRRRGKDAAVTEAEIEKLRSEWKTMAEKREKQKMEEMQEEEEEEEEDEEEDEEGMGSISRMSSTIASARSSRSNAREWMGG